MDYRNDDMPTQLDSKAKGVSPAVTYALVAVVVLLTVALIGIAMSFNGKIGTLNGELTAAQQAQKVTESQLADAVKQINDQIVALDKRDQELALETKKVKEALAEADTRFGEYKTAQETRLAELLKSLEEIQVALRTTGKELDSKLQAAKQEMGTKNEEIDTKVTDLKKDKEFLVTELAKKAEKAYVNFVEKKLNKQIGEVSGRLDEVDGKVVDTQNRLDKMGSDMNKAIKDQVDEKVKLDFQPANPPKPESPIPEGEE